MTRFIRLDIIIDVKKLQVMGWRVYKYRNPAHVKSDILPTLNKLPKVKLNPVNLLEILQKEETP